MLKLKGAFNYETHPAFGRGPCSAFLKESLAKNFVRQPFGWLGCPVNWNLTLSFFAARRREGDISPPGEVLSSEGKYPKFAGAAAPVPIGTHSGDLSQTCSAREKT